MIPLHDDNPTAIRPYVTIGIIALNVLAYLWEVGRPVVQTEDIIFGYGFIPAVFFGHASLPPDIATLPAWQTIFTAMFLHGSFMHIAGNMLYLWIFGNNVEDAMGHVRFIVFYGLCGVAAALAQAWPDPGSEAPMIGASGAIGGVLGGYFLLHPNARVLALIPFGFFLQPMRIPAWIVLGLWFVLQIFSAGAMTQGAGGGVAYLAHVGGFAAGVVLIVFFRRRGVPLWSQAPGTYQLPRPSGNSRRGPWDDPPPPRGPWG